MKILFLDIDGVLNSEEDRDCPREDFNYKRKEYPDHWGISKHHVSILNSLFEQRQDIQVVLSSTWRLEKDEPFGHEYTMKFLRARGYNGPDFCGVTPHGLVQRFSEEKSTVRYREIACYLFDRKDEVDGFVILDDLPFLGITNHLVWVRDGIEDSHVAEVNSKLDYIISDQEWGRIHDAFEFARR